MFWCFDGCSGPSPVDFAGYLLCREMHDNVFDRGPYCIERCITVGLASIFHADRLVICDLDRWSCCGCFGWWAGVSSGPVVVAGCPGPV